VAAEAFTYASSAVARASRQRCSVADALVPSPAAIAAAATVTATAAMAVAVGAVATPAAAPDAAPVRRTATADGGWWPWWEWWPWGEY